LPSRAEMFGQHRVLPWCGPEWMQLVIAQRYGFDSIEAQNAISLTQLQVRDAQMYLEIHQGKWETKFKHELADRTPESVLDDLDNDHPVAILRA
jgi:hypothetical protein